MSYAVIKSIHLISVIAWMAALLYEVEYLFTGLNQTQLVKSTLAIMARLNLFIGLPAGIILHSLGFIWHIKLMHFLCLGFIIKWG